MGIPGPISGRRMSVGVTLSEVGMDFLHAFGGCEMGLKVERAPHRLRSFHGSSALTSRRRKAWLDTVLNLSPTNINLECREDDGLRLQSVFFAAPARDFSLFISQSPRFGYAAGNRLLHASVRGIQKLGHKAPPCRGFRALFEFQSHIPKRAGSSSQSWLLKNKQEVA